VAPLVISVAPNTGAARDGSITVGTSALTIAQAAASCTYAVSSNSPLVFPQSGGTASIDVVTQPGCDWNVTDVMLRLSVTSGASGSGNGTVTIQAAPNQVLWLPGKKSPLINTALPENRDTSDLTVRAYATLMCNCYVCGLALLSKISLSRRPFANGPECRPREREET